MVNGVRGSEYAGSVSERDWVGSEENIGESVYVVLSFPCPRPSPKMLADIEKGESHVFLTVFFSYL